MNRQTGVLSTETTQDTTHNTTQHNTTQHNSQGLVLLLIWLKSNQIKRDRKQAGVVSNKQHATREHNTTLHCATVQYATTASDNKWNESNIITKKLVYLKTEMWSTCNCGVPYITQKKWHHTTQTWYNIYFHHIPLFQFYVLECKPYNLKIVISRCGMLKLFSWSSR